MSETREAAPAPDPADAAAELDRRWRDDPRWQGVRRPYTAAEVLRLRNSFPIRHTLAERGAEKLWRLLGEDGWVAALGAMTGGQALQQVKAGLRAIYVSGWQVAADANEAGQMYPDQSLYPVVSVPKLVRRINAALLRADQIQHSEGGEPTDWMAPLVADGEAGFGGVVHAYELARALVEAGAAGVHFEDQLAAEKKCGHLGGKVLLPTSQFLATLAAVRLATDVLDVPTVVVARTDADSAKLLLSNADPRDEPFTTGERTPEGFFRIRGGLEMAIARGLAYAPYADLLWMETSKPDLGEARAFAEGVRAEYPEKLLAYNCSPSFHWASHLDAFAIRRFQRELAAMGYKFQFVTLAGFHTLSYSMFSLARGYRERGMLAYSELQQAELAAEPQGYTATRHQREVGTGYFDLVKQTATAGLSSTVALAESTETAQFA
jgi:isocitrate lyase